MDTKIVNFIGIGAHKCASTWLWSNLRAHDQVWVPPQKELHYFDRGAEYPSPCELRTESLANRLFGAGAPEAEWRKKAIRNLAGSAIRLDFERLNWWLKFYPRRLNDQWYLSLFKHRLGVLAGEITPAYSMLNVTDIQHLNALCPEVKILYAIRDPIDRAWSHVRYDAGLGKIKNLSDLDEVRRYIDGDALTRRGDYVTAVRNWLSVIPSDRLFIGFYDDIKLDALSFLTDLSDFLEIDVNGFPKQNISENVGVSRSKSMPIEIEIYLAKKYLTELEDLTGLVGGHSLGWLESARARLVNAD